MMAEVANIGEKGVIELSDQGDQDEPAEPRDQLGLAAMPAAQAGKQPRWIDDLAVKVPFKLGGQGRSGRKAIFGILLQALQADRFELSGDFRSELRGWQRVAL